MEQVTSPYDGSWGTFGRTMCPTDDSIWTGMGPVNCTIQDRQLRLYGHIARFPVDNPAHQFVYVRDNSAWRRPMGRPKKSWLGQLDQTCSEDGPRACLATRHEGPPWLEAKGVCSCAPLSASAPLMMMMNV